jgi:hypothetical protein
VIALLLALLIPAAAAQEPLPISTPPPHIDSLIMLRTIGEPSNGAFLSMIVNVLTDRTGLFMMGFAPGILSGGGSTSIYGNGKVLVRCTGPDCRAIWLFQNMRPGANEFVFLAVNASGTQYNMQSTVYRQ